MLIIEPSLWEELKLAFELDEIIGYKLHFFKPEFFEPAAIPLNVHEVPAWLEGYIGYFPSLHRLEFDSTFQHLKLGDRAFTLGPTQGKVIRLL